MTSLIDAYYTAARGIPSDINEHIECFREYASKVSHITEMGVRNVVSSWGFLKGLTESQASNKTLVGVDLNYHGNIDTLVSMSKSNDVTYKFIQGDSAKVDIEPTDILFIDTWHVYGHLKRELEKHCGKVNKYIMMHDTTVDAIDGESIRHGWNIREQSISTGYPAEEISKGLWPAIEEFLTKHPEWKLKHRYTHNNGLTILERVTI